MWVALQEAPQVARITLAGMVMTFPTPDSLSAITEGPDGNLWFTGDNGIGRITPQGSITRFHAYGGRITNARDGNLWF
ncbi:MAG: virginiamycin B lyase family protein, partial [Solirubrobacteraceae bacterium]